MNPQNPNEYFAHLYSLNLIPLRVVLGAFALVIYDYFLTLEDEVKYVWKQKPSLGRTLFFLIRYYTIVLVLFDVLQIHLYASPGFANTYRCVLIDPVTRLAGAISLWVVEIYMQLRIFALYNRSRKVAIFNAVVFIISIGLFIWLMVLNALRRAAMIAPAIHLPLPGCPTINGGLQWALWIPPSIFELLLFGFALQKAVASSAARIKLNGRFSLTAVLLGDNILYFINITILLILNNLMAVSATHIPWFGMAPFHALLGIATSRIMITFYKFAENASIPFPTDEESSRPLDFLRSIQPAPISIVTLGAALDSDESLFEDDDDETSPTTPMLRTPNDRDVEEGQTPEGSSAPIASGALTIMSYIQSYTTSPGPSNLNDTRARFPSIV